MYYHHGLQNYHGGEEEAEYIGQFKAGRREGQGKIMWKDGSYYTGTWRYDMRLAGEMLLLGSMMYQGQFLNDKFHG